MRLVAIAFAAATFIGVSSIGASCPNPPPGPPDVVTDAAPPDCRCKPCPAPDASCPIVVDASPPPVVDANPPAPPPKPSCATACASMRKNGCREGLMNDCATKLCAVNADPRFKHYDVTCLTNAATPGAVINCGMECTQ